MKRAGPVWIRIFPDVPVTEEAGRSAHGLGQGLRPSYWVARVKPGRIMFEIDGVPDEMAREALRARRGQAADQDAHRHAARLRRERGSETRRP